MACPIVERWQTPLPTMGQACIRYVLGSKQVPEQVEIVLIWRLSVMPDETAHPAALEAFQEALTDVLDWTTARFNDGNVFMHA